MSAPSKCPVHQSASKTAMVQSQTNQTWWPNRLDLGVLRQHSTKSDPMPRGHDYRAAFARLDLDAVKADINALMTQSQDW